MWTALRAAEIKERLWINLKDGKEMFHLFPKLNSFNANKEKLLFKRL